MTYIINIGLVFDVFSIITTSFVIFGKSNGAAVEISDIGKGVGGYVGAFGYLGGFSNAGDVNGDGLADLIKGLSSVNFNGTESGVSVVIFGINNSEAATVIDFSNLDSTLGEFITNELSAFKDSNRGFVINGVSADDQSGDSVSSAGDVNGDGLDDLIVGAPGDDPNGNSSGASFVVFGKRNNTTVELSDIESGNGGFVINGISAGDISGYSVSSVGDVNGDGLDDLIIGAKISGANGSQNNASFVVFGKTDSAPVELSDIKNGNGGFLINSESSNSFTRISVSSAGDVNGDGLADLIIGTFNREADNGTSFVVFGKPDGATVELSDIENGNGGFVISGESSHNFKGISVSGAGDVNGDGLDDLIIGLPFNDTNGVGSGTSFVVFGKPNSAIVELSDIENGNGGFAINGVSNYDHSGHSVSSAGDINGDGFADLFVGGEVSPLFQNGKAAGFVVFGGQGTSATVGTAGADTLAGDDTANQLVAGMGDDTLIGNGGADVLRGGAGNDILAVSDLTFASLDGGTGSDTLRFDAALNLDLRTLADTKLVSIEVIDLTNDDGNSTISLNLTDLLNLNEAQTASDTLVIHGNAGDTVNLDNVSNGQTGNWVNTGSRVYEFTVGEIGIIGAVIIDTAVAVNII